MQPKTVTSQHAIIIGIDPGTNTGFAVWNRPAREFMEILSCAIHQAMDRIIDYHDREGEGLFVRFEDARLRTWFGKSGQEIWKGAGSIMRDCSIWQAFLEDHEIHFASMAPRIGLTKLDAVRFEAITGWQGKTNNHGRDAAMLVYGY